MLESERRHIILSLLRQYRFLTIHDLAGRLKISLATVRRDLTKLGNEGVVRRLHGGVELTSAPTGTRGEVPFERRKEMLVESKRRIAEKAVSLCRDGETIIIDGGTTTYHMAEFLAGRDLQVLTNSFAMAEILVRQGDCRVVLPGGAVFPDSRLILNPFDENVFRDYLAAKVFMGINGIGPQGLTNLDPALIRIERAMIDRARELVVLADSSKFNQTGSLFLCGLERVHTIITDGDIAADTRETIVSRGINLITV